MIGIQPPARLCAAASEFDIPVWDVQHGLIDFTRGYYAAFLLQQKGREIPQTVLCWDSVSAESVAALAPSVTSHAIGHPWIVSSSAQSINRDINGLMRQRMPRLFESPRKQTILVSDQRVADNNFVGQRERNCFLNSVLGVALQSRDVLFLVKSHPVDVARRPTGILNEYKQIFSASDNIVFSAHLNGLPALVLLGEVDLHLTLFSSAMIEARFYGIETIACADPAKVCTFLPRAYEDRISYASPTAPILSEVVQDALRRAHGGASAAEGRSQFGDNAYREWLGQSLSDLAK